jgi:carbon storage regulator CsrA
MLVLTRKIDEQILIGDDIKVTLVRVRGNTVRIGIEAPRDVRIVRGELEKFDGVEFELSDREQAFAHPAKTASTPKNRLPKAEKSNPLAEATITATTENHVVEESKPHLFVGKVRPSTQEVELKRTSAAAPLARFIAS